MVSVMPSAVSGLTNHEAPLGGACAGGRGWQSVAFSRPVLRIHPAAHHPTPVLRFSARGLRRASAFDHRTAPSLPTGNGLVEPAARKGRDVAGTSP
jgi:hypothetical protein